jgi:hypothetical protein
MRRLGRCKVTTESYCQAPQKVLCSGPFDLKIERVFEHPIAMQASAGSNDVGWYQGEGIKPLPSDFTRWKILVIQIAKQATQYRAVFEPATCRIFPRRRRKIDIITGVFMNEGQNLPKVDTPFSIFEKLAPRDLVRLGMDCTQFNHSADNI